MTNLPPNPKPNISSSKTSSRAPEIDKNKVISEMTEIIRENKKLIQEFETSNEAHLPQPSNS